MAVRNYSSTAAPTTLSAGVTAVSTTLTVAATTGFPAAPFILALDAGAASQELVLVTNVAGTTLTVTRGYDSTVASAHNAGAVVEHSHAAIEFREANSHVNAATGVHGLGGGSALVGTTDTQTLANKTLTAPSATGSLTGFGGAWTTWTPTITASAGTFTAVSGSGRYEQRGKSVKWSLTITITTVGTAAGTVFFTLPVAARVGSNLHLGSGVTAGGPALITYLNSTTQAGVLRYDNTSPIAATVFLLSGTYEAA